MKRILTVMLRIILCNAVVVAPYYAQSGNRAANLSLTSAGLQSAGLAQSRCPILTGNYMLQGEDGQVRISIRQDGCSRITVVRNTGYLGTITPETHSYKLDGSTQPDSGWFGGDEKYQATPRFTTTSLRIELRAQNGTTYTMVLSLTSGGDLIEDFLTEGERRSGGPTVAKRQK